MPRKRKAPAAEEEVESTPRARRTRTSLGADDSGPAPKRTPRNASKAAPIAAESDKDEDVPEEVVPAEAPKRRGRPPKAPGTTKAEQPSDLPKKRGRPAKAAAVSDSEAAAEEAPKRGRGRPAKTTAAAEEADEEEPAPKRRGRPPKAAAEKVAKDVNEALKRRGRPPRDPAAAAAPTNGAITDEAPKKRGRPAGAKNKVPAAAATTKTTGTGKKRGKPAKDTCVDTPVAKKRRGRPPKSAAATDGAEDDEVEVAALEPTGASKGTGRGKSKGKGKAKAPAEEEVDHDDVVEEVAEEDVAEEEVEADEDGAEGAEPKSGGEAKKFWLMKAEPETRMETTASGEQVDVKFTIDDLAARDEPEPWDGIRNYVARGNLRSMSIGDQCFFAESNCKIPGIVGVMEVVGAARPDPSQFDPGSAYYDPKSSQANPKWDMVLVEFRRKFKAKLPASKLKEYAEAGGPLAGLQLLRQSRLSVSGVSAKEWEFILGLEKELDASSAVASPAKKKAKKAAAAPKAKAARTPGSSRKGKGKVEADDDGVGPEVQVQEPTDMDVDVPASTTAADRHVPEVASLATSPAPDAKVVSAAASVASPPAGTGRTSPLSDVRDSEGGEEEEDAVPSTEPLADGNESSGNGEGKGLFGRIAGGIGRVLASPGRVVRAVSASREEGGARESGDRMEVVEEGEEELSI
ncbi:DUF55-domain-containing protein [Myriangium duriaei CBS 260.36]|uniref:Thymocyte nuclear protein 1 n=1 Tax=Myriangium duriaei CBS 260.36 TaxID=1168546 RepID=A0A9P4IS73_9PEZI|nr:DUF55-domain-containing protein [Myriangium duriaei CBS 260.36]